MQAPFLVLGCGHNHDQPLHSAPAARPGQHYLRITTGGHGWLQDQSGRHELLPGTAALADPTDPGLVWADPDDPYDFRRVSFGGDYAALLARTIVLERGAPVFAIADAHHLCRRLATIPIHDFRRRVSGAMEPIDLVLAEVLLALRGIQPPLPSGRLSAEDLVAHIDDHLARPLSVSALAAAFNVSTPTLTRFCRRELATTPQRLVQEQRIVHACNLLELTHLPVADIAHRVGFDDPFYFSRVFSQHRGCSPRQWRQRCADS